MKNKLFIIICCFATLLFQGQPLIQFSGFVFAQEEGSSENAQPVSDPVQIEIPQIEPTPRGIDEQINAEEVITDETMPAQS